MVKSLVRALNGEFEPYSGMAVAVSGGVDSSLLLAAACRYYGASNCLAIIAVSPSLADYELADAQQLCSILGVELIEVRSNEISNEAYRANSGDRCFWCKQELFGLAVPIAAKYNLPLAYGENFDDLQQPRAGRKSAQQHAILAPLCNAKFTKQDVREYARHLKLKVSEKAAAPCLASRIAVGQRVCIDSLNVVAQVESQLRDMSFVVYRARIVGERRLLFEFAAAEIPRAKQVSPQLTELALQHGYLMTGINLYRSGSVA